MKGIIYVDVDKCVACRSCELACAVEHSESKNLTEAVREEPRPRSRVKVEAVDGVPVPLQCRHCEDAMCIRICPTEALEKLGPGEPVLCKEEECSGCKLCILTCPYGVLDFDSDRKLAIKCDMCTERRESGQLPACVESCPTGALQYEALEEAPEQEFLVAVKVSGKGQDRETEG